MYGHYMQKEYNLGNFFYLDTWPFGPPILMILDPDIAAQVTQTHSLDKQGITTWLRLMDQCGRS
jgi:hypothetical protein